MRRMKQLEDEDAKLKKFVADLSLDKAMLQSLPRTLSGMCSTGEPEACPRSAELVDRLCNEWDVSIRRTCCVLSLIH